MKRLISKLCIVSLIIFFFIVGYAFGYISFLITNPHFREPNRYQLEELTHDAKAFFYKTMYELFDGTYNPDDGYVSQLAFSSFKKYRSNLKPRCRLVNIGEHYGILYGEVFFPSGDTFEVAMRKSDKAWNLEYLHYLGNKQIWRDLSLYYKDKNVENNSNLNESK